MKLLFGLLLTELSFGICVAHRGDSKKYLENSIQSLQSAIDVGAFAIEYDIHHTKDGVPVIMHDDTVQRTTLESVDCPRAKKISEVNWKELKSCRLKNGEPIPLFEEVLQLSFRQSVNIFVELKDPLQLSDLMLLQKYYGDQWNKVTIISFLREEIDKLFELRKSLDFLKEVKFLQLGLVSESTARNDGLDLKFPDKRTVLRLKKLGKLIGSWTIDKPEDINRHLKMGMDFITTNRPQDCQKIVDENSHLTK